MYIYKLLGLAIYNARCKVGKGYRALEQYDRNDFRVFRTFKGATDSELNKEIEFSSIYSEHIYELLKIFRKIFER